ncbi:MAG: hypothetical protein HYY16_04280 [Planctomycetes bacterium]|nr:hypothetical protein [Planctomycetota bacterium]
MVRPPESSDHMFLTVVLELSPETAGFAVNALRAEQVPALRLPHVTQLRRASEQMHPRAFVLDTQHPGDEELSIILSMRATSRTGSLLVILVGETPTEALPMELCELVDAYICKPVEWRKVARTVIQLVNNRKPPSGVILLR